MSFDEAEYFAPRESIERIMTNPKASYRDKLIGLRDYVAHELEANRCKTCFNSQLRTGDTAALVLRLRAILEDIEGIPDPNVEGEVDDLEQLRKRKSSRAPASPDSPPSPFSNGYAGP
jgi:hypothetical protein